MTATNHGLFGAVLAITFQQNPAIGLILAPISHFLLDAIPHYGGLMGEEVRTKKFFRFLFADMTLAVVSTLLVAWVWQDIALLVVVCAFLAASPDLMWAYYQYKGYKYIHKHALPRFHMWTQWAEHLKGPFIYTDIVFFVIFFPILIITGI